MAENILERYVTERSPALRNQLVEANLGIAAAVARKFVGRGVDFDDLYQVASFALLKAIERYEPDRGVKLTSFVVPSMIGEIKNYFRDRSRSIRLPRRGSEGLARVEEARGRLHARLLREPTHAELAAEAGLEMDELIEFLEMRGAVLPASMDEAREDDIPLGETLGAADEGYARVENRDAVKRLLAGLPETERRVIELRFLAGKSQREVAAILNVSQMTVSRAERRALGNMRETLSHES
ncbi:MAG TPA: sigma-70 family RNA polymerase sigma factor [Candidatus Alectryocaccomicrobium excrementavium]|uniref:Sigma-70 family RNA polymerase sigma factor n=1 Tax=Candidatus Alectryocaccomicrobium excrementavium TaxID=2840668 RepID=A0A9D1K639_9FIRM|nr:sigma-70 family RNA polymerase sigma factor [Candidatus Alectryocaccomicrobium excrementavium]